MHQLLPEAQLREVASLPWPEHEAADAEADETAQAFWASDDSTVLICHEICGDEGDEEDEWGLEDTPAMQV